MNTLRRIVYYLKNKFHSNGLTWLQVFRNDIGLWQYICSVKSIHGPYQDREIVYFDKLDDFQSHRDFLVPPCDPTIELLIDPLSGFSKILKEVFDSNGFYCYKISLGGLYKTTMEFDAAINRVPADDILSLRIASQITVESVI